MGHKWDTERGGANFSFHALYARKTGVFNWYMSHFRDHFTRLRPERQGFKHVTHVSHFMCTHLCYT